jgi:hypothetical protein
MVNVTVSTTALFASRILCEVAAALPRGISGIVRDRTVIPALINTVAVNVRVVVEKARLMANFSVAPRPFSFWNVHSS